MSFNTRMILMIAAAFIVLVFVSEWGNALLDVWLEPPCIDKVALDGECELITR